VGAWYLKRWLRALLEEQFTKREIAKRAGLRPEALSRDYEHVTVKTHLKMRKFWQGLAD
jgi:hypothetical protein